MQTSCVEHLPSTRQNPKEGDLKWAFFTAVAVLSSAMLAEDNMPQWTAAATDAVAAFAVDNTHANPRADASGKGTWAFYVEQDDGTQRMMAYGVNTKEGKYQNPALIEAGWIRIIICSPIRGQRP